MNRQQKRELAARLRSWALGYARHGWAVFPLAPDTTIPALPRHQGGRGCLDATTNPLLIEVMWDRYPTANIGLATGQTSRLVVLDIDVKTHGYRSLNTLTGQHGPLPVTPKAVTPSGGRHYLFAWREGLKCSAGQLGAGLDVRSDGGDIVAAPSVIDDRDYQWLTDPHTPLAEWPAWLAPTRPEPVRPVRDERAVAAATADKVLAGLVRVVAEAPKDTRNAKRFWAGARLGEHAAGRISLDVGAAALLDAARQVGLTEQEANRTLDSALRKVRVAA